VFGIKSLLGGALLGRKKYADAEPLLLAGYEGMREREDTIPPTGRYRLTEALEWLAQLYEAAGEREKAAAWGKKLEARWEADKRAAVAAAAVPRGPTAAPAKADDKPNLIVNGSFEAGPQFDGSFLSADEHSVEVRGWVVTRGQIDLQQEAGGKYRATHGKRFLDLHGSPGFGGVKQPFVTRVGQKYKVTFRMSGNPGAGHETVHMAVRAAGQKEVFSCDMVGKTPDDLKWEKKTWEFTAVDTITVLEFHTAMRPDANPFGGPLLDDVRVTAAD
jgi:choice-of-anchor C domain-containing protein